VMEDDSGDAVEMASFSHQPSESSPSTMPNYPELDEDVSVSWDDEEEEQGESYEPTGVCLVSSPDLFLSFSCVLHLLLSCFS
jgi:hypothetical protein